MALKLYKPVNSSTRGLVNIDRRDLWKGGPEKSLTHRIARTGGRNNYGRITAYHRGGGSKKLYRMVNFCRQEGDAEGQVSRIEYDPNRSAFIALVERQEQERLVKSYIVAPEGLQMGDRVGGSEIRAGSCIKLRDIPSGTKVHNLESRPQVGARIVRAAGTFAQVLGVDGEMVSVRLPSGQVKKLSRECRAVIGTVSNPDHMNITYAKAGRMRWLGRRPVVRGTAMNCVDHPNGGGRGKAKGRHPMTPWGKKTKGLKTRKASRGRL